MPADPNLVTDFVQATPDHAPIVRRIVEVIDGAGFDLDAAIKWQQLTFAVGGDFHHWLCAIGITKKGVGLTFHFGGLLEDKAHCFIAGESKFGRKIEYHTVDDVDPAVLQDLVAQAVDKRQYFKENWRRIQKEGA